MPKLIPIDDKQYDVNTLSPTTIECIQLVQLAQAELQRKTQEAKLASIAHQGALSNLQRSIALETPYIPPLQEETEDAAAEQPQDT